MKKGSKNANDSLFSRTFGDARVYNNGTDLKERESNSCVSLTQFDIYFFQKSRDTHSRTTHKNGNVLQS